jgi:hypothetical protein
MASPALFAFYFPLRNMEIAFMTTIGGYFAEWLRIGDPWATCGEFTSQGGIRLLPSLRPLIVLAVVSLRRGA